jgi:DNA modification methylase
MIYCGDALECLEQLPPASVQTCIAHPPYWQGHEDGGLGGELNFTAYLSQLVFIFQEVRRTLTNTGDLWLIIDTLDIASILEASGWYHAQSCVNGSDYILHFYQQPRPVKLMNATWTFPLHDGSTIAQLQHYRPLPHKLVTYCIQHSTAVGDTILDLFSGTGTTSLAAQDLTRHSVAIDSDQIACAMLEARLR